VQADREFLMMNRREFITLLGSAGTVPAMLWPLEARAQQPDRMRRVGMLMDTAESNSEGQERIAAFRQGLRQLGWSEGRNIRIDDRWAGGDVERARAYAAELVGLKPDVIFAFANAQLRPLSVETRTIPLVFVGASESGWSRLRRELCASGRQYHRIYALRGVAGRQLAGDTQGDCTRSRAGAIMVNPDTAVVRGTL